MVNDFEKLKKIVMPLLQIGMIIAKRGEMRFEVEL